MRYCASLFQCSSTWLISLAGFYCRLREENFLVICAHAPIEYLSVFFFCLVSVRLPFLLCFLFFFSLSLNQSNFCNGRFVLNEYSAKSLQILDLHGDEGTRLDLNINAEKNGTTDPAYFNFICVKCFISCSFH